MVGYKRFGLRSHPEDGGSMVFRNVGIISRHTTRCHNPEDHDLNLYCHENLNSCGIFQQPLTEA